MSRTPSPLNAGLTLPIVRIGPLRFLVLTLAAELVFTSSLLRASIGSLVTLYTFTLPTLLFINAIYICNFQLPGHSFESPTNIVKQDLPLSLIPSYSKCKFSVIRFLHIQSHFQTTSNLSIPSTTLCVSHANSELQVFSLHYLASSLDRHFLTLRFGNIKVVSLLIHTLSFHSTLLSVYHR